MGFHGAAEVDSSLVTGGAFAQSQQSKQLSSSTSRVFFFDIFTEYILEKRHVRNEIDPPSAETKILKNHAHHPFLPGNPLE